MANERLRVRISGEFACFTRPEMKVERVSYEVITPSAARGVLEAVLWKPEMRWIIHRITALNPIRFTSVKRNEVASKIPSTFKSWANLNSTDRQFFADDDRQQRNAVLLRDVAYIVEASIQLTARASKDDSINKYVEMFTRRVEKGQHFHQPYLGCREFPATVELLNERTPVPAEEFRGKRELGWMLNDIEYANGKPLRPHFFQAVMDDGVIEVPALKTEVRP